MNTLISMTDFVLSKDSTLIYKYANLLKQPLELWMFVPCSEDGNVLEHPNYIKGERTSQFYNDKMDEYNKAKKRCLFEGFTVKNGIVFTPDNQILIQESLLEKITIENLVGCKYELTQTAQKQIGI
jgi:hypothetical protein